MSKTSWLVPLVLLAGTTAVAAPPAVVQELFDRGNAAYDARRFAEAIQHYETLIHKHDVSNGVLFYNLGNAYFRNGDLGRAVLNYRRALRLLPRDRNVRQNLAVVLKYHEDADTARSESGDLWQALVSVRRRYTLNELLGAWVSIYLILAAALLLRLWLGQVGGVRVVFPYVLWIAVAGLVVVGLGVAGTFAEQRLRQEAVIVAPAAPIRTGPGNDYPAPFSMSAGTVVRLLEVYNRQESGETYAKIELPNGFEGWTPLEWVGLVDWKAEQRLSARYVPANAPPITAGD